MKVSIPLLLLLFFSQQILAGGSEDQAPLICVPQNQVKDVSITVSSPQMQVQKEPTPKLKLIIACYQCCVAEPPTTPEGCTAINFQNWGLRKNCGCPSQ